MTIHDLYRTIWITRGVRFQAHKRLSYVDNLSSWTINLLSIYIIGMGLLALSPPNGLQFIESKTWTILISIFSIFILVISLLESAKKYSSLADRMHSCAKELSTIYFKVAVIKDTPITVSELLTLIDSYQEIINKYENNHKPIDFDFFKASNRADFDLNLFEAFYLKGKYFIHAYAIFFIAIILPIILLIIFWHTPIEK